MTIVAIDGPAGSGKSSVAKAAARALGLQFLDTGAAYRGLAWLMLDHGADTDNPEAVRQYLARYDYSVRLEGDEQRVWVNGLDVTGPIRTEAVSRAVSGVARVSEVRARVNEIFRDVIRAAKPGIVVEGRDITSVVAPDADVRILLTASPAVRAARRQGDVGGNVQGVSDAIAARDAMDSEVADFMEAAEGVTLLDSTDLNFAETVDAVMELVRAKEHS